MITAEYTLPGIHVRDHRVDVPLDWAAPDGPAITVFARELVDPERRRDDLPYLTYLQGGPGGKSPRPTARSGWIGEALKTHRVVLLDQRGTGRSTPVDGTVMAALGTAEAGAAYLSHFLAPSIVADAEHLRKTVFGGRPWTTLGQSYGGFLTLCYLSQAPEGLHACLVTGGLASVTSDASDVYRHTYPRVEAKNRIYRERYPHDVDVVARVADRVAAGDVVLPDGDVLTVRRLQALGMGFGMKPGFERVHWLFDEAFAEGPGTGERLTDTFLAGVRDSTAFYTNPLYAALQETIYGSGAGATAWAAERERAARPQFGEDARPLLFTGEMVYPWMFEEIRALRPFRAAVELLAARDEWPALYDLDQLAANEVPLAAAVYFDDMYVDSGLQLETVSRVGNAHAWVTNEYEHDGLHEDARVFSHLRGMLKDRGLFGAR
ncbi:alpha/beta fold hydrolase [Streptomyces montanisoli]|uniref:Alpha/beta fold hydrolase n=1 Tax=Streptomyces montanisoli TaxID=2798581 RepID=A0A940ME34_9ACTN|nr:alpha/beta fold hydrolase [Streptomyces montanisoli]MBP0459332.1 alpha/beta fold hydrolase [Streptomyces montanisoli]